MAESDGHSRKVRFGAYELDGAARELRKNGVSVHLQDQPWEVLSALVERHGEVVSREELRRRLWPDGTFVDYEQSLNKAVNKLREALCDSADKPRYVETVARRGYRFVGMVEGVAAKKVVDSHWRRWRVAGALGLVAAGVLVTGLWPVSTPKVRVTPLTRDGRPKSALLALHDGRILYTTPGPTSNPSATEFWSIATDGGEPRRESMPFVPSGSNAGLGGLQPKFGEHEIFVVSLRSNTSGGELWLAGFDGSKPKRVGVVMPGSGYSISPDLKTLLRASKEGLFARSLAGGPERLVTSVDWKAPSYTFWHPSGERIGFLAPLQGTLLAWEVKPDGTGKRQLAPEYRAEHFAANWSPDGNRLYFVSSRRELFVQGSRRWLGWMRRPEPERLTTGEVGFSITFEDPRERRVLYSTGRVPRGEAMKLNGKTGHFEPYLNGLSADCFDYSPDGQWIAYVRFPTRELWKCRRDGSDTILLDDSLLSYMPRWSPDGKSLAFAAAPKAGLGGPHRIYTISAEGGTAEPVKGVDGPGFDPNWSPDGKRLVFAPWDYAMLEKQDRRVSIVEVETGRVEIVPGSEEMFSPRWSLDGKYLVTNRWKPPYPPVLYDFENRRWTELSAEGLAFPAFSKDSKHVFGIVHSKNSLVRIEVATRRVDEIRNIKEFRLAGTLFPGVFWTPDGESVILVDHSSTEVYRIDVEK